MNFYTHSGNESETSGPLQSHLGTSHCHNKYRRYDEHLYMPYRREGLKDTDRSLIKRFRPSRQTHYNKSSLSAAAQRALFSTRTVSKEVPVAVYSP